MSVPQTGWHPRVVRHVEPTKTADTPSRSLLDASDASRVDGVCVAVDTLAVCERVLACRRDSAMESVQEIHVANFENSFALVVRQNLAAHRSAPLRDVRHAVLGIVRRDSLPVLRQLPQPFIVIASEKVIWSKRFQESQASVNVRSHRLRLFSRRRPLPQSAKVECVAAEYRDMRLELFLKTKQRLACVRVGHVTVQIGCKNESLECHKIAPKPTHWSHKTPPLHRLLIAFWMHFQAALTH